MTSPESDWLVERAQTTNSCRIRDGAVYENAPLLSKMTVTKKHLQKNLAA
jgi:adenylosuccinate lyase